MELLTKSLSATEVEIVKRALQAAAEGDFFPDWEFETLVGVDRETVRMVYEAWPHRTIDQEDFGCAIVGTLNNLLGYPHGKEESVTEYVPQGRDAMRKTLDHLVALGV